ncbi:CRISPR-associated protein Cas4 [Brevibacillus ruminantium]|uniref:CRISPR-associated exonuclease Cas4 n=1 Tax=Brevibacillus ruminantium TaxID=2950604 RepID=A0ABY4WJT0_9BACL|nr:CRISPR-associated protein Cas4 [Brevibacillus ruminantium]USG67408.1 CRISPR-associated protein Cas4 [Brevibacillus ruminantium]
MMDYNEEDFLLLSGIQHFNFCRRQWALIHIEQQWEENVRTLEGAYVHRVADQPLLREKRGEKLIVRALPVHSKQLGVAGICDVVEFVRDPEGISLAGEEGLYLPFPVEYKRGKPKKDDSDRSQLIAQMLCLEEMLVCELSVGYLYYDEIKQRVEVPVTPSDKEQVRKIFREMHHYFQKNHTPKAKAGPHCQSCSLNQVCLPEMMNRKKVSSFIESRLNE